jgi:hypothetical protein
MADLSPYTVTIMTKDDSVNGFNVIPNAPIEIRERLANGSSGSLSLIYSDQAGTTPITQTGATANALGQFTFFAVAAQYNADYDNNGTPVSIHVDTGVTNSTLTNTLSKLNPATLAIAVADTNLVVGDVLHIKERTTGNGGGAIWDVVLASGVTPNTYDIVQCTGVPALALVQREKKGLRRFGSFSIVIDTSNAFVRDSVLPIITTRGYAAAIALPTNAIDTDYSRMTLEEIQSYTRDNDGEVLSHSGNGIVLDASVQLSYGNSLIRSSKLDLVQYGFKANAFVAISSTLDSKFLPEVKKFYDYAFITSNNNLNDENSDRYNLNRVALEGADLNVLKSIADDAKNFCKNVVYYTHDDTVNLAEIIDYCDSIGLEFELPSTWFSRVHGLSKPFLPQQTENLVVNTAFEKADPGDLSPIGWSIASGTMSGLQGIVTPSESGATIDVRGTSVAADERLLFSQVYQCDDVLEFTPFTISSICTGLDATNTDVRITISARDAGDSVITQSVEDYTIRGSNQRIFATLGVISTGTAVARIQVVFELISLAAGAVRAIFSQPMLSRNGSIVPFIPNELSGLFAVVNKSTAIPNMTPHLDYDIIFNTLEEGLTEGIYSTSTGLLTPSDGGLYNLSVILGLQNIGLTDPTVKDDAFTCMLYRNGVEYRRVQHNCWVATSASYDANKRYKNIFNSNFVFKGDGASYKIVIQYHGVAANIFSTAGVDARMTIHRNSN